MQYFSQAVQQHGWGNLVHALSTMSMFKHQIHWPVRMDSRGNLHLKVVFFSRVA